MRFFAIVLDFLRIYYEFLGFIMTQVGVDSNFIHEIATKHHPDLLHP